MKQNTVKLNESQLKKIVSESVKKVLNEALIDTGFQPQTIKAIDNAHLALNTLYSALEYEEKFAEEGTMPWATKIKERIANTMMFLEEFGSI